MADRYELSVVREDGDKKYWTRIGVMFPWKNGEGFNLIFEALPVPAIDAQTGKLQVRVVANLPLPKDEAKPRAAAAPSAKPRDAAHQRPLDDEIPF